MKRGVRKKFVAVSAAAIIAGAGLGSFVVMDGPAKVGIKGVPDLLAMMRDRSPGERAEGALTKKNKKEAPPAAAAAAERDSPEKTAEAPPAAVPAPVAAPAAVIPAAVAALPAAVPAAVPAAGLLAIPPLIIPTGGGGGGLTVTQTPPPPGGGGSNPPPPPPGPDVPEPATWLMMLLGFGMVGGMLRWKKSQASAEGAGNADSVLLAQSSPRIR